MNQDNVGDGHKHQRSIPEALAHDPGGAGGGGRGTGDGTAFFGEGGGGIWSSSSFSPSKPSATHGNGSHHHVQAHEPEDTTVTTAGFGDNRDTAVQNGFYGGGRQPGTGAGESDNWTLTKGGQQNGGNGSRVSAKRKNGMTTAGAAGAMGVTSAGAAGGGTAAMLVAAAISADSPIALPSGSRRNRSLSRASALGDRERSSVRHPWASADDLYDDGGGGGSGSNGNGGAGVGSGGDESRPARGRPPRGQHRGVVATERDGHASAGFASAGAGAGGGGAGVGGGGGTGGSEGISGAEETSTSKSPKRRACPIAWEIRMSNSSSPGVFGAGGDGGATGTRGQSAEPRSKNGMGVWGAAGGDNNAFQHQKGAGTTAATAVAVAGAFVPRVGEEWQGQGGGGARKLLRQRSRSLRYRVYDLFFFSLLYPFGRYKSALLSRPSPLTPLPPPPLPSKCINACCTGSARRGLPFYLASRCIVGERAIGGY